MLEALPNAHAALVHLPIVLLPAAFVLTLVEALRKDRALTVLATATWWLAALAAVGTFLAGREAADDLVGLTPEAMGAIATHSDRALWVVGLALAGAFSRTGGVWLGARRGGRPMRVASLLLALVAAMAVVWTADAGGALVYRHGVAVDAARCPEAPPTPLASAAVTPSASLNVEGTTTTFLPGPAELPFTAFDDPTSGGTILVDGERTLLLDGEWDDVQLNAWLDRSAFNGRVDLLFHVGPEAAASFLVDAGRAALVGPDGTTLEAMEGAVPATAALAVNVAGHHLKGLADGKVVVHGHGGSGGPGAVGLRFTGTGAVVVKRVEVIRIEGE